MFCWCYHGWESFNSAHENKHVNTNGKLNNVQLPFPLYLVFSQSEVLYFTDRLLIRPINTPSWESYTVSYTEQVGKFWVPGAVASSIVLGRGISKGHNDQLLPCCALSKVECAPCTRGHTRKWGLVGDPRPKAPMRPWGGGTVLATIPPTL